MSLKYKAMFICFLVLTIFSLSALSYTLYIIFGTSLAIRTMKISLSDFNINENESKANFSLVVHNPSSIYLTISFLRAKLYFNDFTIGKRELSFQSKPLGLPANTETNLSFTLSLSDQFPNSEENWTLNLYVILNTPLPQKATIDRSIRWEE